MFLGVKERAEGRIRSRGPSSGADPGRAARVRWQPLAAGTGLLAMGVLEAVRLGRGDLADARRSARTTGATRLAAGSLLLGRPDLLPRLLASPAPRGPSTMGRLLGVRELALGLMTLRSAGPGGDPRTWLLALALVDTGEALVLLRAARTGGVGAVEGASFVLADLGSTLAGVGVLRQLRRSR